MGLVKQVCQVITYLFNLALIGKCQKNLLPVRKKIRSEKYGKNSKRIFFPSPIIELQYY